MKASELLSKLNCLQYIDNKDIIIQIERPLVYENVAYGNFEVINTKNTVYLRIK